MLLLLLACIDGVKTKSAPLPTQCDAQDILEKDSFAGLSAPVRVRMDSYAIPHVDAATDDDAFYVSGYLQARDRLFELEMMRRRVHGEKAEILGEDYVQTDKQARLFGFGRYGCESIRATYEKNPEDLRLAIAFLTGVNDRIAEVNADTSQLPAEFQTYNFQPSPWRLEDFMAVGQAILFGFSNSLEFDLLYTVVARTVPNYQEIPVFEPAEPRFIMTDAPHKGPMKPAPVLAPLDPAAVQASTFLKDVRSLGKGFYNGAGSNNWAVSGRVTEDGRPMLANDTHSALGSPNTMYMEHIRSPNFNVAGFAFVGVPSVHLGHNAKLAWSATTTWADVVDMWDVASDGSTLSLGGEDYEIVNEEHTIKVKQADGSIVEEPFVAQYVPEKGVLLTEEVLGLPTSLVANGSLLMNWVGFGINDDLSMFLAFDRSDSLSDFVSAVDEQDAGMMNWLGATADGIHYHTHAKLPTRGATSHPNMVLDGNDPGTLWTGWLGTDKMPDLDDSNDYIVTANNDPWGHTADNDSVNDDFYFGSFYDPGWRADRASNLLKGYIDAGGVSFDEMISTQLDTYSQQADQLLPLLENSVQHIDTDGDLADYVGRTDIPEAWAKLAAWDRRMVRSSESAALYHVWVAFLMRRTLADEVGLVYSTVENAKPPAIEKMATLSHVNDLPGVLDRSGDLIRLEALSDALAWLDTQKTERGLATITWGDIHVSQLEGPDGTLTQYPTDGDSVSINSSECHMWGDGGLQENCVAPEGPILRQVTRFAEDGTPEMYFNAPDSNDRDMTRWIEGQYVKIPFTEEEIAADTVSETTLE